MPEKYLKGRASVWPEEDGQPRKPSISNRLRIEIMTLVGFYFGKMAQISG